jgi:hypothetical protein
MHQAAEIQIILHTATKAIPLEVSRTDSVHSICAHLDPSSDYILMYGDFVLCGAFSLAYYGIASGAHIYSIPQRPKVALPPEKQTTLSERVIDREVFSRLFHEFHGPNGDQSLRDQLFAHCDGPLVREIARLRDNFCARIEGTFRCHRNMVSHFIRQAKKGEADDESTRTKKGTNQ